MLNIFSATVVFVRIFAAYYLVNTIMAVASVFSLIGKGIEPKETYNSFVLTIGLGTLAQLLVACLVLIYAKKLAIFITRDLENDVITLEEANYDLIQAIGFSLLGMYLLIHAIPATIKILASYAFPATNNKYEVSVLPNSLKTKIPLPDILSVVVQLVIGVWLLLGSKRIATLLKSGWSKGRTMGQG